MIPALYKVIKVYEVYKIIIYNVILVIYIMVGSPFGVSTGRKSNWSFYKDKPGRNSNWNYYK